jgi:polyphosphate kinase
MSVADPGIRATVRSKPGSPAGPTASRELLQPQASLATDERQTKRSLDDPELYINRELSLLEFQRRVLEEAQDPANPLLERVKFLAIFSSNIDEFFMVRVAGLLKQVASGTSEVGIDGRSAGTQLQLIRQVVSELSTEAHRLWREVLRPELAEAGIQILEFSKLDVDHRAAVNSYFLRNVFPVLTPLAVDESRPFPHISSRSLNLAVVVKAKKGGEHFARVKIPDTLPQLVEVKPPAEAKQSAVHEEPERRVLVWLEQVIAANLALLFPGVTIVEAHPFRVTRDADVAVQELESDDLLETVEEAIRQRRFMSAVRLQVSTSMPDRIVQILTSNIEVDSKDVYRIEDPIAFTRLAELTTLDRPDLKDRPFVPYMPRVFDADGQEDIFALMRREDVLLHHPYDSFQPVTDFLRQAARDPHVLAIKMTLYRVGRNSPIVAALLDAVEDGKQVAVLVELKARFDEESNIEWARKLEDAGVHVVYGVVGLKVHSKIALVVRQEGDSIRRYLHLSTGNYNPVTARVYSDFGLFTCDEDIAEDSTFFFNSLTGYSAKQEPSKLLVAPVNLTHRLHELIRREIRLHSPAAPGRLVFKMNALEDPKMIQLLYEASRAGVQVELLVRGFCCLRPGVPGVSENIRVTSIVGRFLEHSRIYYFHNGGAEEVYLGSADLMRRSLRHRVEIIFPVRDAKIVARLKKILEVSLADTAKARYLASDGCYHRNPAAHDPDALNSQEWLLSHQGIV